VTSIVSTILLLGGLALITGLLLQLSASYFHSDTNKVIEAVNRLLPQSQCAQCGYAGCRPYAQAVVEGEATNRCPPGGETLIANLASLLNRPVLALADELTAIDQPVIAKIKEHECIGCSLCIKACPVDAIIGAPQLMHTVISQDCTGCELCLAPCPVDCIDLIPAADAGLRLPLPTYNMPCIHCSACMDACPRDLAPQQLFLSANKTEPAHQLRLADCIECGLCDRVCPSRLPLTRTFRVMKHNGQLLSNERSAALRAEAKFNRREQRLVTEANQVLARPKAEDAQALLDALREELNS